MNGPPTSLTRDDPDVAYDPILEIEDLSIDFATAQGPVNVVRDLSLSIGRGETLGLVGESGSGKSVTSLAILGLIPQPPGRVIAGRLSFDGIDLLSLPARRMEDVRGRRISMIFQEPMTSLNPAFTVGEQIGETIRRHNRVGRKEARQRAVEMLERVHISRAASRLDAYPHEFSGGMRQRVVIATALSCEPDLLIADEPTTALDVTVQAQILELLKELRAERNLSILLITHDLGVVADICDSVAVMYSGELAELSDVVETFRSPQHPYTEGLLSSVPRLDRDAPLNAIAGTPPQPWEMPTGCRFAPRCEHATERCRTSETPLRTVRSGHATRCIRVEELALKGSLDV